MGKTVGGSETDCREIFLFFYCFVQEAGKGGGGEASRVRGRSVDQSFGKNSRHHPVFIFVCVRRIFSALVLCLGKSTTKRRDSQNLPMSLKCLDYPTLFTPPYHFCHGSLVLLAALLLQHTNSTPPSISRHKRYH